MASGFLMFFGKIVRVLSYFCLFLRQKGNLLLAAVDVAPCERYGLALQKVWFCGAKPYVSRSKRYGFATGGCARRLTGARI